MCAPFFFLFSITACDDDDRLPQAVTPDVGTTEQDNTNRNPDYLGSDYARLEFPHVSSDESSIVLIRRVPNYGINYAIEYDRLARTQRWTCWQWHQGNSGRSWNRNNWDKETDNPWAMLNLRTHGWGDPFQPDPDLPEGERTELDEYNGIPYQRGHICASADRLNSKEANEQTFYLSNIMPQSAALNSGIWLDMENKVQDWGRDDTFRRVLYVVKGGTIDSGNIRTTTATGLIVPRYFYMALLCEDPQGHYKALAFWVEHTNQNLKSTPLRQFVISVEQLQERTGIDFFCNLPDSVEHAVENATTADIINQWGL